VLPHVLLKYLKLSMEKQSAKMLENALSVVLVSVHVHKRLLSTVPVRITLNIIDRALKSL
jgi:hypothetical protein